MGDLVLNNLVYPALLAGFIGISALVLLIIWGSWIFEKIGSLFKKKIPTRQYFRVVNPEGVEVDNYSSADDEYLEQWYETKEEAIEIAKACGLSIKDVKRYFLTEDEATREGLFIPKVYSSGDSDTIYTGPRGGRYRYNSKGRKSYDV